MPTIRQLFISASLGTRSARLGSLQSASPACAAVTRLCVKKLFQKMVGITPEYSRGDKIIAWGVFVHSFVINFLLCFVGSVVWNLFHRWPTAWWGRYFVVVNFVIPGIVAALSTVWFAIGGAIDLRRLFRDLAARRRNDLDNGMVEGHVSLADKARE